MRILPPAWEGLHPSYPEKPAPFNDTPLSNALINSGAVGFVSGAISALFRRGPSAGLTLAAWTALIYGTPSVGLTYYAGKIIAQPYIESKGIQVPNQRILDRPFNIDADNWIFTGALGGVGLAASLRKPWGVSGWKRWLGSMSMGATTGYLFNTLYNYQLVGPSLQVRSQHAMQRAAYSVEVKAFLRARAAAEDTVRQVERDNQQGHFAMTSTSLQEMLKGVHDAAVKETEAMADKLADDHDIDEEDPRPHFSETNFGERTFLPQPNYKWQSGTNDIEKLESHIQELKQRRARLTNEAAFLFHSLAVKQSDFYNTSPDSPKTDQRRVTAEMVSHLHAHVYLEISRIDWCIADAQMSMLQLKKKDWLPPKTKLESSPKHLLELLDGFEHENEVGRAEMDMLEEQANAAIQEPGLSAFNTNTGKVVDDPYAQIKKDLLELKKAQKESDYLKEATAELKTELESEGKSD